jgi:demethylmenaquinone methyltransferase/2-methoxy-6-polyprenyl-1,4-benzoquinol methylase
MLSPKSTLIREMFSAIAPRYDLLNHFLSLNIDTHWRKMAVTLLRERLAADNPLCLDLCCGTGDLSLEMRRQGISTVVGCDFSHSMLDLNREKTRRSGHDRSIHLAEADALDLPFPSATFDGVAIGFGLRNLDDAARGLAEIHRVLKPGGILAVLEFSKPSNPWFNRLFQFYFSRVLPGIGNRISKHNHAYGYLPASVRLFPSQQELMKILRDCGFAENGFCNLTGGIAAVHYGTKRN